MTQLGHKHTIFAAVQKRYSQPGAEAKDEII